MAFDEATKQVLVALRRPAKLVWFGPNGSIAASLDTCDHSDDVFIDAKRRRLYVSCGEGFVDVVDRSDTGFVQFGRLPTASGARTSFFYPEMDRLFVAVRATAREPAAIWVYRPSP